MGTIIANEYLGVREARARLTEIVKRASGMLERFVITSRGKPEAVVISIEEYEDMLDALQDVSNPKLVEEISKARADYKRTGGIEFGEYRKERAPRSKPAERTARSKPAKKGAGKGRTT